MDSNSTPEPVLMSSPSIVLVGNPNTGKSTLFNALTGQRQLVANYPGVTVAKKSGQFVVQGRTWNVVDLPGTYSLVPRSPDEQITADVLAGRLPGEAVDVVVCVLDASNLRRNLYLASQVLELKRPTIVALTKLDILRDQGQSLDSNALQEKLGVPVVSLDVLRKQGLAELHQELEALRGKMVSGRWQPTFAGSAEIGKIGQSEGAAHETDTRYAWIDQKVLPGLVQSRGKAAGMRSEPRRDADAGAASWSDRLDGWLTHGVTGSLFFVLIMFALFYAVFQVAGPAGDWVDLGLGVANSAISNWMPDGMFRDLLLDGVIGGVGNFLVFLPQIFVLFLFIGLLESTGYMARAAYLMDRVFSPLGLSGKSFVPLLSSFACAIPGIMATRIIERPRDRLLTIMVAPLMSCSARLPVYSIMISAVVTSENWVRALVLLAMYLIGVITALGIVWVWKKVIWREASPEFLLELPEFQFPNVGEVLRRTIERSGEFVVRAGTIILALTILVWAANYFPRDDQHVAAPLAEISRIEAELAALPEDDTHPLTAQLSERVGVLASEVAALRQENSYLGRAGKWIEPVVRPLGWDWRIGCAALASFPAREVIVTTLGILYQVGEPEENSTDLEQALRQATWADSGKPVFTIPVALSIMVFFALCSQCASTLAVIYQETRSLGWPLLSFVYMTVLAYVGAFLTYQIGTWLGGY
jgi:ferrous iron transport protein B